LTGILTIGITQAPAHTATHLDTVLDKPQEPTSVKAIIGPDSKEHIYRDCICHLKLYFYGGLRRSAAGGM